MPRREDLREQALKDLQHYEVLMLDGHFDFGNGYHGPVYLHPHKLFRYPSTIWRFAQDLLDIMPTSILQDTEVVAGPVTGGALLAHTMAGLLDSRRKLDMPPTAFAPFSINTEGFPVLSRFYRNLVKGKKVLLADDVRNTGQTLDRCAAVVRASGGVVLATCQIYDRVEAVIEPDVPNTALAEYQASPNYPVADCPLCRTGIPITTF
tara:strand:+ start:1273 stop:1893 length:621 start_codon:yes stop_codon:yes gene_type:complete